MPTLLMLHGEGRNEYDMVRLAKFLSPNSSILSMRGKIIEGGRPLFIQRVKGGRNAEEIKKYAREIQIFLDNASMKYSFQRNNVIGVGYFDGAAMAVALSLSFPASLKGLILFRVFMPFHPEGNPDLAGLKVIVISGRYDKFSKLAEVEELVKMMSGWGAKVNHVVLEVGHEISSTDVQVAKDWFEKNFSA